MKRKHQRLTFVVIGLGLLGLAAALVLSASREALVFFLSPTDIVARTTPPDHRFRLGGVVEEGSVVIEGHIARFSVTDFAHTLPVRYSGILPDLFREGQGVVAEGRLEEGVFVADQVLAKHDETYMPPEVADALKKAELWQHGGEAPQEDAPAPATEGPRP